MFTLPHELTALAAMHPQWVYDTLVRCTAATLTKFAAHPRWLGGTGGFTLVLHTWTQNLRRHVHVYPLMACGALQRHYGADRWVEPKRGSPRDPMATASLSLKFRPDTISCRT